jgi:Bacterial regulatory protein, Fis family
VSAIMLTTFGALRLVDRPAWTKAIVDALRDSDGNRTQAAKLLGVSHRQFCRWLRELGVPQMVNQHHKNIAEHDGHVIGDMSPNRLDNKPRRSVSPSKQADQARNTVIAGKPSGMRPR